MLNNFMKNVFKNIHESLAEQTDDAIKIKTKSIGIYLHCTGIQKKQAYGRERFQFLISQHIVYYIDLHIQESKRALKGFTSCNINSLLKKRNQMLDQNNNRNHSIDFVKATFLHHYLCGSFDICKSVKIIEQFQTALLSQYQREEITLQTFKENQHIKQLINQRQFSCICRYEEDKESARCQKCMKKFHPQCQYQKIVCNRCFLSQYFYPIESAFFSKFGQKRKTYTYFHSKFRCYNPKNEKKMQFFVIKFDIDDFQDLQNATQPQFFIKIINFRTLGSDGQKLEKWRNLNSIFSDSNIFLNFNRFEFFINFFQLRRKHLYFRDENSLIFKLQNRLPKIKDNILVIKCDTHFFQDETYQIGIQRVSKIKKPIISRQVGNEQQILNESQYEKLSKSIRITSEQFRLLKKYSKNKKSQLIQNVKAQKKKVKKNQEDDDSIDQNFLSYEFVRSYACNHKEGFDLAQLKRSHLNFMEKTRQAHRNKDLSNQIKALIEKHLFKQYKKHAMRMNIKTQQEISFNQTHFQSIKRYCIENNLLKHVEIPQLENFQQNVVDAQIKKYIGSYYFKNKKLKKVERKNKKETIEKQEKKYRKFARCPVCQNFLSILYLLPYQQKQGQQIRIPRPSRTLKRKKIQLSVQQEKMMQMFRPKSIFRLSSGNKKQEESHSEEDENQNDEQIDDWEDKQDIMTPKILIQNRKYKQVIEQSQKQHKIYIIEDKNKTIDNRIDQNNRIKDEQQMQQQQQQVDDDKNQDIISKPANCIDDSKEIKVMSEQSSSQQSEQNEIQQQISSYNNNNNNNNQRIQQQQYQNLINLSHNEIIDIQQSSQQQLLQQVSFIDSPIIEIKDIEINFRQNKKCRQQQNIIAPITNNNQQLNNNNVVIQQEDNNNSQVDVKLQQQQLIEVSDLSSSSRQQYQQQQGEEQNDYLLGNNNCNNYNRIQQKNNVNNRNQQNLQSIDKISIQNKITTANTNRVISIPKREIFVDDKKSTQFYPTMAPKQTIQISLLSSDQQPQQNKSAQQQQQGQIKISNQF